MNFKNTILIYTDGACSGNPGPGGWAAVIALPEGEVRELGGGESKTTNNRMELMAAIQALKSISDRDEQVCIYTDSVYVIRGITQWIWGWKKRGWKSAEGADVANREEWEELLRVVSRRKKSKIEWKYVRGHKGVPGNERCDEIAVAFSKGAWVSLYEGPLLQYEPAIYDVPEDEPLPEMKQKGEAKKPAFSYLSLLGGVAMRHATWAECERRVKGQSGAKFKKAMSPEEEAEILKGWGAKIQK